MRHRELAGINLNTLVTLDALLATRSVSEAARQLGLTSSAVSHTLRQLREQFGDPLMVRHGNEMQPTPRAKALIAPLRQGLLELEAAVRAPATFEPARSDRWIHLAASDSIAISLLNGLLTRLQERAPNMRLNVIPLQSDGLEDALATGSIDLAFIPGEPDGHGLHHRRLFDSPMSVLVWRDHPEVGQTIDLDTYCALPHAVVSNEGRDSSQVDRILAEMGRSRVVTVRAGFVLAIPSVLIGTRLLVTFPRVPAEHFARLHPLQVFDPPIGLPHRFVSLVWHERFSQDPAIHWFRDQIIDVANALPGQALPPEHGPIAPCGSDS